MKVNFLYNIKDKKIQKKFEELKKYEIEKVEIYSNLSFKTKCELYVIISNEFAEVHEYLDKINNKGKIMIITENVSSDFVLFCIGYTKNMAYLFSSNEVIMDKIKKILVKIKASNIKKSVKKTDKKSSKNLDEKEDEK